MARVGVRLSLVGALLFFAATAVAFFAQRSFIFPAPADYAHTAPPGFELVRTRTEDGLSLAAFYRRAALGKPTILFFHGNADDLMGAVEATRGLADNGNGLMLIEYRGYGGNAGSPTEQGLYLDGAAGMRWLADHDVPPGNVIVVGQSVGSGPATETARRYPVAGLALISAFSSLPDAVSGVVPLMPRWLVRDRFDNVAKLPRIDAPVLLMHGAADRLIPPAHFRRLGTARPEATRRLFEGEGHDLGYTGPAQAALVDWLNGLDSGDTTALP